MQIVKDEWLATRILGEVYGEEFEIIRVSPGSMWDGYITVLAAPADKPELIFTARINSDGSGESDNYISRLKCLELSEEFARNLDGLEGIFYVSVRPLISPYFVKKEISLKEYLESNPDRAYNVYLAYAPDDSYADINFNRLGQIYNGLGEMNLDIYLYVTDEDGVKEICDYMESHDAIEDDFDYSGGQHYKRTIKVRKGRLCD